MLQSQRRRNPPRKKKVQMDVQRNAAVRRRIFHDSDEDSVPVRPVPYPERPTPQYTILILDVSSSDEEMGRDNKCTSFKFDDQSSISSICISPGSGAQQLKRRMARTNSTRCSTSHENTKLSAQDTEYDPDNSCNLSHTRLSESIRHNCDKPTVTEIRERILEQSEPKPNSRVARPHRADSISNPGHFNPQNRRPAAAFSAPSSPSYSLSPCSAAAAAAAIASTSPPAPPLHAAAPASAPQHPLWCPTP